MSNRTIIIAEAGVNHNGSYDNARTLVKVAAESGADFVKFQTFKANKLVSKVAQKAEYQKRNTSENSDTQYSMLKKLEMPDEWHLDLKQYADSLGIKFLSTAFDLRSIDFLDQLGIEMFKIPSGEINNLPYLKHIAAKKKSVILSTGMAGIDEIREAVEVLQKFGLERSQITVLHCNTEYPTPMKHVNLMAMNYIKAQIGVNVGYSDHTIGIEVPIAAVALGATIIEKHFTLDKRLPGPDHVVSLDPGELKAMITGIRNIEFALSGSGIKEPSIGELENRVIARKSIHLSKAMKAGTIIAFDDLEIKRPGDGISPMRVEEIIGKKIKFNFPAEHKLRIEDFE